MTLYDKLVVTKAYSIRLDDDTIARLDRLAEAMKEQLGIATLHATRTDALRMAAMMGLEQAEADFGITTGKKKTNKKR